MGREHKTGRAVNINITTCQLEVGDKFLFGDQGVVGLGPLELADPRVFYNAEDEFLHFAFRGF